MYTETIKFRYDSCRGGEKWNLRENMWSCDQKSFKILPHLYLLSPDGLLSFCQFVSASRTWKKMSESRHHGLWLHTHLRRRGIKNRDGHKQRNAYFGACAMRTPSQKCQFWSKEMKYRSAQANQQLIRKWSCIFMKIQTSRKNSSCRCNYDDEKILPWNMHMQHLKP